MITKWTKDLIGKTIFAKPTGNNGRYNKDRIEEFVVIDVSIKYATLSKRTSHSVRSERYNVNGATEKQVRSGYGNNAGYEFFKDKKDLEENSKRIEIINKLQYRTNFNSLSNEALFEIFKIVQGE